MKHIQVSLYDQIVEIICAKSLIADIEFIFRNNLTTAATPARRVVVEENGKGAFSVLGEGYEPVTDLSRGDLATFVMEAVVRDLVTDLKSAVAIHAGAVDWNDKAILIAGTSGSGKSSLTAWFTSRGFRYLTDEVALLNNRQEILGFPRAMVLKPGAAERVVGFSNFRDVPTVAGGEHTLVHPNGDVASQAPLPCGLILFPKFIADSDLCIHSISAAETAMQLIGCNLNARNLPDGGFRMLSEFARNTPAIGLSYGDFEQLEGILEVLAQFILESPLKTSAKRRFLSAFSRPGQASAGTMVQKRYSIPSPTPRGAPRRLTIGMATYDDYDGVYFSLQALRLYHPEVTEDLDFLVVDNHPDGACAAPLKALENHIPNYRYVPFASRSGTAVRDAVFEETDSEFVLCMDCHVFIVPGALKRLLQYFLADPGTKDLLQGPLVNDNLTSFSTHFEPQWRDGMYGYWATDERGKDNDGPPFDIPMQGLGLFACARKAWPGFNPLFRGFGGEEGYIHEKFRRRGGRTLCVPFLRWVHRFQRPLGLPYKNRWEDRIRNYVIGFRELSLPTTELADHFRKHIGGAAADVILREALREADSYYEA